MATGTYKPLWARCTIYWDNGQPHVLVTADVLAFARSMNQAIRRDVEAFGVDRAAFALCATHTHNGPVLVDTLVPYIAYNLTPELMQPVYAYSSWLVSAIVQLVHDTLNAPRTPCTLHHHLARADFSHNREGLSYIEHDVPVLVARSLQGAPLAVLFGYGCHPVASGSQTTFDPDYPGEAVDVIEGSTGAFAQFVLGAAGDQGPTGTRGRPLRDMVGRELGVSVANAVETPGRPVSGRLRGAYREVTLPLDVATTPQGLADARAAYIERQRNHGVGYYRRHAEVMIEQLDKRVFDTTVPLPLQVWRFDGDPALRIAFIGGEPASGYAVYFRARHGGSNGVWVNGYANEVPAYIPSDELVNGGGAGHYACGWSPDQPGIAGGSMTVYGHVGKFLGRPRGTSTVGVEQILIGAMTDLLA
ncbi:hypothetical protein [Nonomuraea sp. NPDC046570]|uniref:hypothetical protein n=1 Tax=Nonomuraea sp. NPDC046570 TaxID=3155255 RepID=UPI0033EFEEB7